MHRGIALVGRWLHREQRDDLEQVVLDHVAQTARAFVEAAALADAEALGHRHLNAGDVVAVPDRLEKRVRESEIEDVHDRLLSEIVVDAEDRRFREYRMRDRAELDGGREIAAEGLFDDEAGMLAEPIDAQARDDRREQRRRYRQVIRRAPCFTERALQRAKCRRILVVAAHVTQQRSQAIECRLVVDRGFTAHALANAPLHFLRGPLGRCDADDRHRQRTAFHHGIEGREDLPAGEVAGEAEDDQCIGTRLVADAACVDRSRSFLDHAKQRAIGNAKAEAVGRVAPHSPCRARSHHQKNSALSWRCARGSAQIRA